MIKITEKSKIYVIAPAYHHTGGVELAHQLVDYLRRKGRDCYIVYIHDLEIIDTEITKEYAAYHIVNTTNIEDLKENILILPEIYSVFMKQYTSIQYGFWWMSVDNYVYSSSFWDRFCFFLKKRRFRVVAGMLLHGNFSYNGISFSGFRLYENRMVHFYQSTYAKITLINKKIRNILPLSDYINIDLAGHEIKQKRDPVILYNPNKGYWFTEKIIKSLPEYTFIPLKDLNRSQLKNCLSRAKLYIDFGEHPGKDRLPREAAINGCCIVTSEEGSASYFEDIPIDASYKFPRRVKFLPQIADRIRHIMENYDHCLPDFDLYRKRIRNEKDTFLREIDIIFMID